MPKSLDLLDKALTIDPVQANWCRAMSLGRTTLSTARNRGKLSPTIAGNLALLLGEDECYWIALAGLEAEPESPGREQLMKDSVRWRKR